MKVKQNTVWHNARRGQKAFPPGRRYRHFVSFECQIPTDGLTRAYVIVDEEHGQTGLSRDRIILSRRLLASSDRDGTFELGGDQRARTKLARRHVKSTLEVVDEVTRVVVADAGPYLLDALSTGSQHRGG